MMVESLLSWLYSSSKCPRMFSKISSGNMAILDELAAAYVERSNGRRPGFSLSAQEHAATSSCS